MKLGVWAVCGALAAVLTVQTASAQSAVGLQFANAGQLAEIPAVAGYERELSGRIREQLRALEPKTDNLGNVYVTVGSGAPHRLIVAAIDEPGYVVSGITPDGFLRVQRLPQTPPNAAFDLLHAAQPAWVITRDGKRVSGVFAGLSVHLEPLRLNPPKMSDLDQMYVDIGAASSEEVRAAGVDILDSVALQRQSFPVGQGWAGPAVGDRFGCEALLHIAERLKESKKPGTTTIAFVTQQWTGGRGLNRILEEIRPDEMVYVGRLQAGGAATGASAGENPAPGSGVLLGVNDAANPTGFPRELQTTAEKEHLPFRIVTAPGPRIASYAKANSFPERVAMLGIPTLWPATAGEYVSWNDTGHLMSLIGAYLDIPQPSGGIGGGSGGGHELTLLEALVESYGASGHEEQVRKAVLNRLDPRVQKKVEADTAGNLTLHLGDGKADAKTPKILIVAHMDEIGYQVRSIEPDGRLLVDVLGGGYTEYFLGHVVLIHKSDGTTSGGVLELADGWDRPGFEWPHGPRAFFEDPAHVYVGTRSAQETHQLGIKTGDWITIPKQYRPLLGTRVNARSFDDRVGCAALIQALQALGPDLPGRDVTFVWSTQEEVGLKGAAVVAERMAKEGKAPDFVFAVDTFVSSDSPLESKRFADAEIGKGFVIRAVDNSNIAPREYVERVIKLARENNIPVQYGVTGGGNDGAVFQRYGSVDIPLGWPLRYSHSPGEVIDTRDVDALARIITVLAKKW